MCAASSVVQSLDTLDLVTVGALRAVEEEREEICSGCHRLLLNTGILNTTQLPGVLTHVDGGDGTTAIGSKAQYQQCMPRWLLLKRPVTCSNSNGILYLEFTFLT